ncbi:magnesium dechelatase SGRL, chloroplastic-like [Actinidia eriantha]|uniref:magnesium dechelatase SGRL, chloroplastic-like n=1 Tax=Actinidia eriantha TaxID=165200 RepID=UPI002589A67B|nr:magnesium dechelatase SGRL, chloroplastic-like [Actinidia eriantha]
MHSMACHCASYAFSPSPHRDCSLITNNYSTSRVIKSSKPYTPVLLSSLANRSASYNTFVFQAAQLLGPPARFEASKLKVVLSGKEKNKYDEIVPRTYTLSHCDLTANLTLTISNAISLDQLKGWYCKDDVVAEWKEVKGNMFLDVHCYVSGPNLLLDLAAEFRYHIFSKELPLVLKAVMHGDSLLFEEHQELMEALVHVYFHSSLKKYNRVECWGPLKDASAQGRQGDQISGLLNVGTEDSRPLKIWGIPKSIFQALFAFLL